MYNRRCMGKFKLHHKWIDFPNASFFIPLIFENMVIVEATMHYYDNHIHYIAMCDEFDVLEDGFEPLEYFITVLENSNPIIMQGDSEDELCFERTKDIYKVIFKKKQIKRIKQNERFKVLGI